MKENAALLLIDLQNDFCPGGSLAVPHGDEIIPLANQLKKKFDIVIATQDWHPQNHISFASNNPGKEAGDVIDVAGVAQHLWPDHCVQNSQGAAFHPALQIDSVKRIFHKGTNPDIDSYSAFFDNEHLQSTGLADYLKELGVNSVFIMGLATDYCVKYSVLDALHCGFDTYVIVDGCRGVELKEGDSVRAVEEMLMAGAEIMISDELVLKGGQ